jgi:hypothetical protein
MKINKVVIIINRSKPHAQQTASELKTVLDRERVKQEWIETLAPQRNLYRRLADLRGKKADLIIACGGAYAGIFAESSFARADCHRFGDPVIEVVTQMAAGLASIASDETGGSRIRNRRKSRAQERGGGEFIRRLPSRKAKPGRRLLCFF